MRVKDFVINLKEKVDLLPDTEMKDKILLLCWGAADINAPIEKKHLIPFIDLLMSQEEDNISEICGVLAQQLVAQIKSSHIAIKPSYISPLLFRDWHGLLALMSQYPVHERIDAMASLNLAQLSKVILNGVDFRKAVNNKENYVGDEDHARNVLMSLGYYYHELVRTRTNSFKHASASFTGYENKIKLQGISQILKFFESGRPLSDFEKYLNSDRFNEIVASTKLKDYTLKDAVMQGELGDFCRMITYASKPENREPAQPKQWFSFGR